MTNEEIKAVYLGWLESMTGTHGLRKKDGQRKSYSGLLSIMLQKEFVWLVPNDDNRLADGLELRREFFYETGLQGDLGPCSILEVLVALSRRLAFTAGGEPDRWAWQLIENLELQKMSDPISRRKAIAIDEILECLIWRNYEPDGQGSFFPLIDTDLDMRKVEIWYQMSAYVQEIYNET